MTYSSGIQVSGAGEIYAAALGDDDPNVVITAVENLGRTRAEEFRGRIEDLLQAGSHPMLVGACLEALVGIGHQASLDAIRRRFPDLATLPDFFLASCLKAIAALGSAREFAEVASLLPVRGAASASRDAECAARDLSALPVAGTRPRICYRFCGRWLKMAIRRCAAIRRCGFWAFGPFVTTSTRSSSPACPVRSAWFAWGRPKHFGSTERPGWGVLSRGACARRIRRGGFAGPELLTGTPCQTSLSNNSKV